MASAIGGCGTRLIDHVNAMASLGRMGVYMPQTTILQVTNSSGQVLKSYKAETKQVIDPQAAYIVNDILGDSNARAELGWNQDYLFSLNALRVKAAAKTGTSNGEVYGKIVPKDIWTVGYTPNLSMAVWLGNPDTTPLRQGNSLIPAMLFDRTMAQATKIYVEQGKAAYSDWYTAPAGIQRIGNEVYPSYYTKTQSAPNATMTFDKVSKKKATSCTPAAAKIDIGVTKTVDPYTKKDVFSAPDGYTPTKDDDAHQCGDAQPTASIGALNLTSETAAVTVTSGRYDLQTLTVTCGNVTLSTQSISVSGNYPVSLSQLTNKCNLVATITDTGYYSADSLPVTYTP